MCDKKWKKYREIKICLENMFQSLIYCFCFQTLFTTIDGQHNLMPQRFAIEPSDKTAIVGDTVILPCRVDHKVGTLQWTRDGFGLGTERSLNGFPRYLMIGSDDEGDFSLQINSVALEDDAVFQCQVGASEGVRGIRSRSATFTVFVSPESPIIVESRAQGDYLRTTAGMSVELTCEAHAGKPPAELTWLDGNGNPVTTGISYTTQLLSDGKRWNAALKWTFVASKEFDGKRLTCRSENAALKQPKYTHLRIEVKYSPEVSLTTPQQKTTIGENVQFVCEAKGNPNQLVYKWFRDDELIVGDHGSRLTLNKVTKDMNGVVISCEVGNSVGISKSKHALDVAFGPQFLTPLESVFGAEIGNDVKLKCDVEGNPRPDITWFMVGSSHVVGTGAELVIRDMSREKVGTYVCRVSVKGFEEISAQTLVFIKGPPKIKRPFIQYGIEGERVKVECLIESIPAPNKITWSHNSRSVDVDNNEGYEIVEEETTIDSTLRSMIVIRKSQLSDFGSYNCCVWNEFGFDSKILTLVQQTNFSPLVLSVGIIICGIVFVIATTITIILCLKRKKTFNENACAYDNDLKKGQTSTSNGKQHLHLDSGSSGASDSDIKVEIRTASSLSQHWPEESLESQRADTEMAQVVENIYSYSNNNPNLSFYPQLRDLNPKTNGIIASYDYNTEYLQMPNNNTQHAIIVSSIDNQRASYAIDPTYGTLVSRQLAFANPYLRTSNSLNNNSNSAQLSAGMYSASQRYITPNCGTNCQLATHV